MAGTCGSPPFPPSHRPPIWLDGAPEPNRSARWRIGTSLRLSREPDHAAVGQQGPPVTTLENHQTRQPQHSGTAAPGNRREDNLQGDGTSGASTPPSLLG